MWCNLSPRPGQKLISVPSPTSDHLPLFELLCWQGAHGSGCAGLAWSKEGGKSDLEVILMWSSPAHRAGKQSRVLGQSFRDAESISGELDGYQGGEGPSTPRVFCVSYFTAHCKMVCSRNSFPVDNEFTREEIIRQLQNWQKWKLSAGEDGHGAFFCTAVGMQWHNWRKTIWLYLPKSKAYIPFILLIPLLRSCPINQVQACSLQSWQH